MFDAIIGITMFLCFFALSANMSANLYAQTKEIGVMRAIGFTKIRIQLLFFYEAIVLVFSSSFLGMMIGISIGFTMTLQQTLLMQLDLAIYFPWEQLVVIFVLTLICAFFSTFGPSMQILNKQISSIFRSA